MARVLVVGAGAAGLAAAREIAAAGHAVVVVDKGRGVGGRLATRRIGEARLDHGAQFFTARSARFAELTGRWLEAGVVREWCRGFRQPADGHPRYVGVSGMTALAKDMAAGLDVRVGVRLGRVGRGGDGGWVATGDDGRPLASAGDPPHAFDAVVLTPPVPQSLDMAGPALDPAARTRLEAVRYEPTLAALLVLGDRPQLPPPGGVQFDDGGPLGWIGDNQAKGVSPVPAVTVHASGRRSQEWFDRVPAEVLDDLVGAARAHIGPAPVVDRQLARWRYATPAALHDGRSLIGSDGPRPLVCAGDAFGEAKVEGAIRSGWSAAEAVLDRLAG